MSVWDGYLGFDAGDLENTLDATYRIGGTFQVFGFRLVVDPRFDSAHRAGFVVRVPLLLGCFSAGTSI